MFKVEKHYFPQYELVVSMPMFILVNFSMLQNTLFKLLPIFKCLNSIKVHFNGLQLWRIRVIYVMCEEKKQGFSKVQMKII